MPRKSNKDTPTVIGRTLYTAGEFNGVEVNGQQWGEFKKTRQTFYFDAQGKAKWASFTARCEERRNGFFWYAFAGKEKKTFKAYIGRTETLGSDRLEIASKRLYEMMNEEGEGEDNKPAT